MLSSLLPRLAGPLDRLASFALTHRSPSSRAKSRSESLGPEARVEALAAIDAVYGTSELLDEPDRFFGPRREISPSLSRVGARTERGVEIDVSDASWPSAVSPFHEPLREKYLEVKENHRAAARLFLARSGPRPTAVLVHGYRAGEYAIWERSWPLSALLRTHDVALFVLPFHGVRKQSGGGVRFPASDPRITNEGFRQAVSDFRDLSGWLQRRGAPRVGIMGMSLGGYTAALVATVEPVDFVVPFIPLASFADVALASGRLVGTSEQQRQQHAALERVHRVVSPFGRPSKVPPERALVCAGAEDRITPLPHAQKLAEHFRAPLEVFPGGHLLQVGRKQAFRKVIDLLRRDLP